MEVTETTSDGLKRELRVVVGANELNQRLSERLHELKNNVRLKGFRPGKVPVDHLRKIYGRSVMAEIIQQTVNETSQKAVTEREERPAVKPDVSLDEDEEQIEQLIAGQADLAYTMSFEVLPEVTVTDLSSLELEKPVAEVSKEEVDEAIERLVEESVTYADKEGPAAEGDQVVIDLEGTIDGVPFEGGKAEDAPIVLGKNQFIPGFEEQLTGVKAGDEKTVEVTFPEEYPAEHLAGKPASFAVTVKKVGAPERPEVDEKFAETLGFESVEKLREAIEKQLGDQYASHSRTRVKRQLLDALDEAHDFALPEVLVNQEFETIWKQVERDLEQSGKTFADEGTSEEEERERYRKIAERRVRLGLVLSEIGEKAEVKVSDEEVNNALMERLRQYPGQERQVYEFYQQNPDALAELRAPLFEDKVVDYVLELADVKEKKVSKEELLAAPDSEEDG